MKFLNLGELYDYINFIANKDQLGEPVNPEKFALLLRTAESSYYEGEYEKVIALLDKSSQQIEVRLFNNTSLARFLKTKNYNLGNIENSLFDLPDDLGKTISSIVHYNNVWRPADFLNITEFNTRRYNVIGKSPKRVPVFTKAQNGYEFVPHAIRRVRVFYIRKSFSPIFDYCIGVDDDSEYYMPPGSTIKKGDKNYGLYSREGMLMKDDVVHLSNPTEFPYNSTSVELDWDEEDKVIISDIIIAASSVRSRELNVAQAVSQSAEK